MNLTELGKDVRALKQGLDLMQRELKWHAGLKVRLWGSRSQRHNHSATYYVPKCLAVQSVLLSLFFVLILILSELCALCSLCLFCNLCIFCIFCALRQATIFWRRDCSTPHHISFAWQEPLEGDAFVDVVEDMERDVRAKHVQIDATFQKVGLMHVGERRMP